MKLIILDAQYLIRRSLGQDKTNHLEYNGIPTGGVYGFINTVKSTASVLHPHFMIGVWDGGHSRRRKSLLPLYKDKQVNLLPQVELAEYQKFIDLLIHQVSLSEKFLHNVGIPSIRVYGKEADDVMYYISELFPNDEITLVSEDHDFLHLVDDHISVYRPRSGVFVDKNNFSKTTSSKTPQHDLLINSCTSDPAEHPGIAGVSSGTASKYVNQLSDDKINLDGLEELLKSLQESGSICRRGKLLLDSFNIVRRNNELINIRLEEFSINDRISVKEQLTSTPELSEESMYNFLITLGMKDWVSKFDSFMHNFNRLINVKYFLDPTRSIT